MGWPERIQRLHAESGGLLDLLIVTPSNLLALIALAHAGDAAADRIANATSEMMTIVRQGSRRVPTLCTGCSKPLRAGRYNIVVASAADATKVDDAITMAFCDRQVCGSTPAAIQRQAAAALRKIWPGVRQVPIAS